MLNIETTNIENSFFYAIKLNMKCENCDNEYKRVDNFCYSEKKTKKYFDEYYENISSSQKDKCSICDGVVSPEEIINIKEHKLKKYLSNLGLYINNKYKVVPTNTMKLIAITLEGVNEDNKCEAIITDLSEENYKRLWDRGKYLWDNGYISKYIICFMENDKCFRFARPDQENFEICRKMDNFMRCDDTLEIYNSNIYNDYFLIGDSQDKILRFYRVEEIKTEIPIERGSSLEIS